MARGDAMRRPERGPAEDAEPVNRFTALRVLHALLATMIATWRLSSFFRSRAISIPGAKYLSFLIRASENRGGATMAPMRSGRCFDNNLGCRAVESSVSPTLDLLHRTTVSLVEGTIGRGISHLMLAKLGSIEKRPRLARLRQGQRQSSKERECILSLLLSSHHVRVKEREDRTQPRFEPSKAHFPNEI